MLLTSEYLGQASIPGYIWKAPGESFPRAVYDETSTKGIAVELYKVSPRIVNQMARLEIPYGYYPQLAITKDKITVLMWASVEGHNPDCTMLDGVYK